MAEESNAELIKLAKASANRCMWNSACEKLVIKVCNCLEQQQECIGELLEALETKSYDLVMLNYYEKGKNAEACSICGQSPHKKDCKYGQAIAKAEEMIK